MSTVGRNVNWFHCYGEKYGGSLKKIKHRMQQPHYWVYESESESRSVVSDSATTWITQSMEFSRPEYWGGLPFPSPGDFPNPGIEAGSPALQVDSLAAESQGKPKNTGVGSLYRYISGYISKGNKIGISK